MFPSHDQAGNAYNVLRGQTAKDMKQLVDDGWSVKDFLFENTTVPI